MFFSRNKNNQTVLDKAADEFLNKGIKDLLALPDYGSGSIGLEGKEYLYGWWRWELDGGLIHFVFQIDQKVISGFYYKFLSGLKITNGNEICRMHQNELANYD